MTIRVTNIVGGCEYIACTKGATKLVYDRVEDRVLCMCVDHAYEVADKQAPEYIVDCPNCGCKFGVN